MGVQVCIPSGSPKPDQPVSFVLRRFQNCCLPISEVENRANENEKSLIGGKNTGVLSVFPEAWFLYNRAEDRRLC